MTASSNAVLIWRASGRPKGLTLSETGVLSGPPTETFNGLVTITATVPDTNPPVSYTATFNLTIGKRTPSFGSLTVGNGENETTSFTYGDTIHAFGTISASTANSLTSPANNQEALFLRQNGQDTQLTAAEVRSDGAFSLTYDTAEKQIGVGTGITLVVKYGGSDSLNGRELAVPSISLSKKQVTARVQGEITKGYDGNTTAGVTLGFANGAILAGDMVSVAVPCSGERVTYQWKRDGVTIDSATGKTYTIQTDDIGKKITVTVSGDDVYHTGSVTSDPGTQGKLSQSTPPAPTRKSVTTGSIEVNPIASGATSGAALEYSIDAGKTWQPETLFDGLSAGTTYQIVARYQATDGHNPSDAGQPMEVATGGGSSGGSPAPTTYPPTISKPTGGTVTGDKTVTDIIVTDQNGNHVPVTNNGNWTFKQPSGKVTISVVFSDPLAWVNPFIDVHESDWFYKNVQYVSASARTAMAWAVEKGIITGVGGNRIDPQGNAASAQLAAIIQRYAA